MKDSKPSIIKKYIRQSRSPFTGDDSTILLLATVTGSDQQISLGYDRYIYLHRDCVGKWLGVSLSNALVEEMADGSGKYRSADSALMVLLHFHQEIKQFLRHFSDEIESVFGMDSETWMIACKARWRKKLSK